MSKVAVIFWSGTGNTQAMAKAIAEAAKSKGAEVDVLTCSEVGDISSYDSVALGCPAMGAEELEDSEFLPMLDKAEPQLGGKKVGQPAGNSEKDKPDSSVSASVLSNYPDIFLTKVQHCRSEQSLK